MTTVEQPRKYRVLGTSPLRPDGVDKVTGRALYGSDIRLAGTLVGKVLRSPHAHARIKSIDVSAALKMPGVHAIATAKDFPPMPSETAQTSQFGVGFVNIRYARDRVLASQKVLYKGHAIAGIAADTAGQAEEALAKIKVEYEVLPSLLDVREAMKADAIALHETIEGAPGHFERVAPNSRRIRLESGDIAQGFKESDVIVEREFHTATVHHGFIEPPATTVDVSSDGSITAWSTTQGAFFFREQLSKILQVPENKIKVIPTEVGGAFGGKEIAFLEPVAAILSHKSNKPVKITMTRAEVFEGTGPACGSYIKLKVGAKKTGELVAAEATVAYEAGAFPGSPVHNAAERILWRYRIPNQLIDGYDVLVNKPRTNSYRAPGATQCHFAAESVIDELAEKLKLDPIDFRLKNAVREGDRNPQGLPYKDIGSIKVLEGVKAHPHYRAPLKGPNRGRGVAFALRRAGGWPSSANVAVNNDGTVSVITGSPDMSGTRMTIGMQVAEAMGLPIEAVKVTVGDTESVGLTFPSWGSRVTFSTGWAAVEAAREAQQKLVARAAQIWGTQPENVEVRDGSYYNKADAKQSFTFKQLADKLALTGGAVTGSASIDPSRFVGVTFAACIIDVHVDPETGKVDVERCTVIQDVGQAIHRSLVEGQIQGATAQAIGWALNEEYFFDQTGRMTNSTLLDYRMPLSLDLPQIDTVIVEVPNPNHPYGVRGAGEDGITTPPSAIATAIYNAVGVRPTELPMAPRNILKLLWAKNGHK